MMDRSETVLEERLPFLFEPDALALVQYLGTFRSTRLEPEKRLMLAVLQDAVQCYQRNVSNHNEAERKLFRDAEQWFFEEGADRAFSFESICDTLGISAGYLRRGLRRWKEVNRKRASRRGWEPMAVAG